eukprot:TRINITY_DN9838_c0_g1_i1.p1 TRINITY_DN9838_c0_g1~~TRINITY_DN9838_c0_g1_i1.p1  ORF type:complete len:1069 (-),score=237.17 TRINITY_DN9838_c0_g1_i1:780-3986(-)
MMAPASPMAPRFLVGQKLKQPVSPKVPVIRPLYLAPCDCAQSSTSFSPCWLANAEISSIRQLLPNMCVTQMARVLPVIAAAKRSGSRLKVASSGSTSTGRWPARTMARMVAIQVLDATRISLPAGNSRASMERISASKPLATPMQWRAPAYWANSASKAETSWPSTYQPERMTRVAACSSSAMKAVLDLARLSYSIKDELFIGSVDIFATIVTMGGHHQQDRSRAEGHGMPGFRFYHKALAGLVQHDGFAALAIVHVDGDGAVDGNQALAGMLMAMPAAGMAVGSIDPVGTHHLERQRVLHHREGASRLGESGQLKDSEFRHGLLFVVHGLVAVLLDQFVALCRLQVFAHHFAHQVGEGGRRRPAQFFLGLGGVAQQGLDLRRTEVARIHGDTADALFVITLFFHAVAFPAQLYAQFVGGSVDEVANTVLHAGGDDEVLGLVLLQHQPLHFHVVACMAPVTLGVQIAQVQAFLQAQLDARQGTGDLAGDEGFAAARRFVVEQDAVAGIDAVGFTVVDHDPVAIHLGHGIGAARVEGGGFLLRDLLDQTVEFGGAGLVEAGLLFESQDADGLKQAQYAQTVGVGGVFGFLEADGDVALRGQIVDFVRLGLLDDANQRGRIGHVAVMQEKAHPGFVTVAIQVVDPIGVEQAGAALDPVDDIAFVEQQFCQVGTVLAGDAGDEGNFGLCSHGDMWFLLLADGAGLQKILVSRFQACLQGHGSLPPQRMQSRAVHELARRAVGFAGVEVDAAHVTDDAPDQRGEISDGDVVAESDVDMAEHRPGMLVIGLLRQVHDVEASTGHVVHIQELAARRAATPDRDGRRGLLLGFVEASDQGRDDVGIFAVVVVARAVEIGGHHAAVVDAMGGAVLPVVAFAELDAGDLGHGIGLVGGLQCAGQQRVLGHRLGGQFRIDAGGAELQQPLHPGHMGGVNHVAFDHQVFIDELRRIAVVGQDPAHPGGGEDDPVGLLRRHELRHLALIGEVQLRVGAGDELQLRPCRLPRLEPAQDRAPDHAAMAGHIDLHAQFPLFCSAHTRCLPGPGLSRYEGGCKDRARPPSPNGPCRGSARSALK